MVFASLKVRMIAFRIENIYYTVHVYTLQYIADTIREKVAVILASTNFMSSLSDGSQARKVKDEKELALVRTERNGIFLRDVTIWWNKCRFLQKSH